MPYQGYPYFDPRLLYLQQLLKDMKVEDQALLASAVQDMAPEARAGILNPLYSPESGRPSDERSSQEDLVKLLQDVNKKVNEYEKQTEKLVKLLGQIQNEIALLKQNEEMTLAKTLLIDNFIGSIAQNGPAPYQGSSQPPSQMKPPSQSRSQPISQQLVSPRISTPVPTEKSRFNYDPELAQPITTVNTDIKNSESLSPTIKTIISSESPGKDTGLSSISRQKTSSEKSSEIRTTSTSTSATITTRMRPVARMRLSTTRPTTTMAKKVIPRTILPEEKVGIKATISPRLKTSTKTTLIPTLSSTTTTSMKAATPKMSTGTVTITTPSTTTTSTTTTTIPKTTTMSAPLPSEAISSILPEKVTLTRSVDLVNKFLSAFEIAQNINDSNKKVEPFQGQASPTSPRPSESSPSEVQTTLNFVSEDIVIPEVQTTIENVQGQESTTLSPRSKLASDKNSKRRNKINQSMEFDLKLVSERNRRKRLRLKPVLIEIERNQQNINDLNSQKIAENDPINTINSDEIDDMSLEETTFAIDVTTMTTTTSTVSPEGNDKATDTPVTKSQPQNQVTMSPSEVNGNSGSSKSSNGQSGFDSESEKEFLIGQIMGKNEEKSTTISPPLILPSSTSGISQTIPSTVSSTIQMSSMSSMPSTVIASQNINLVNGSSIQDPKGLIPSVTSTDTLAASTTVMPTIMTTSISGKCFIIPIYSRVPAFQLKWNKSCRYRSLHMD